MKINRLIIVLAFLCLISETTSARGKNTDSPFFFVQLADPQLGFSGNKNGVFEETAPYEKAVAAINKLGPDFVVITGDLVNDRKDKVQLSTFKEITGKINSKIPVYYTPGNHDIGNTPTTKDIDTFISEYGHEKFAFKHNKSVFIGFNSCIIKANTPEMELAQFDWLKEEIERSKKAEHIILFCHHPFFVKTADEAELYFNIPVEIRNKYISMFAENGVNAIFAGHLHNNAIAKYKNMDVITTSAVGKPLGEAPSGIRIVKVYPDHIESNYYSVNEIPETITF